MRLDKLGIICPMHPSNIDQKEDWAKVVAEASPETKMIFAYDIDDLMSQTDDVDALFTMPILDPEGNAKLVKFCLGAKSLKWVHCLIAGVDSFIHTEIGKLPIVITSTKGIQHYPMSDTVIAFVYSWLRRFPELMAYQLRHEWNGTARLRADESINKTIGFVGYGEIGAPIAKKFKALGFHVLAAKRTPVKDDVLDECYTMDQVKEMLPKCDFVVLICPLTDQTYHLINDETLACMKKNAFLINRSRGAVVDDEALVKALKNKVIAGAGLDIFVKEPLTPDNPYWDLDNVIISHHISPMTPYINERTRGVGLEQIKRWVNDEPMKYIAER
ncbi:MAG: D-2-hydroxyacid dehydrogenase [Firmicutes bacterium]|nr:D-2-hydroxyacid dehydrogenase [Bacillota bacterium]